MNVCGSQSQTCRSPSGTREHPSIELLLRRPTGPPALTPNSPPPKSRHCGAYLHIPRPDSPSPTMRSGSPFAAAGGQAMKPACAEITSSSRPVFGSSGSGSFLASFGWGLVARLGSSSALLRAFGRSGTFGTVFLLLFDHLDVASSGSASAVAAASSSSVRGAAQEITGICLSPINSTPAGAGISPR